MCSSAHLCSTLAIKILLSTRVLTRGWCFGSGLSWPQASEWVRRARLGLADQGLIGGAGTIAARRAVGPQGTVRHPEAGSSWLSWPHTKRLEPVDDSARGGALNLNPHTLKAYSHTLKATGVPRSSETAPP